MRLVALALLVTLGACGGSAPPNVGPDGLQVGPPPSFVVYVQAVPVVPGGNLGLFTIEGGDGYVRIREDLLGSDVARQVLVHELGHAIGLSHNPDPSCATHASSLTGSLCPAEVAYAQGVTFTLALYVGLTPGLQEAAGPAVGVWNDGAGRSIMATQ